MKFLFINPARNIGQENIWGFVNSVNPPLGLAMLAAVLEREGHQADIIDAAALGMAPPAILSAVKPDTDVVGLTATTPEIMGAIDIARAVRARFPSMKILMGGVHPTIFHRKLVEEGICDLVLRGEGEHPIRFLASEHPTEKVPNLTWRSEGGEVVSNPADSRFAVLDDLPFPAYDKLPMNRYRSALGAAKRSPSIGMITSRGCPGKCTFCYSGMFGSKIRFMSAEKIVEHILFLKTQYGIREISFYDDTFTALRKRIERLCTLLIAENIDISWSCFARVDSVSPELLKLMKEAGCHQICYGFESADEEVLRSINKRIDEQDKTKAIRWTKDAGIDIRGAFMLGSPGETEESMQKTIDYSKNIGIQFAMYNITTPFPGTALFDSARESGMLGHTEWNRYDLAHPVLDLPSVSSKKVQQCYYRAYREFYFRPSYILKSILSIRTKYEFMTYMKVFLGMVSMVAGRSKR